MAKCFNSYSGEIYRGEHPVVFCGSGKEETLVVSFAALPPGRKSPRAQLVKTLFEIPEPCDKAFVVDYHFSWYLKSPVTQEWDGRSFFVREVAAISESYSKVILIGGSMGGTGALYCAEYATHIFAFSPQVDLVYDVVNGPNARRPLLSQVPYGILAATTESLLDADRYSGKEIHLFAGKGQTGDCRHIDLLRGSARLNYLGTNQHNTTAFLSERGAIVPMIVEAIRS